MAGPSISGHVAICVPGVVRTGMRFGEKASSGPKHVPIQSPASSPPPLGGPPRST